MSEINDAFYSEEMSLPLIISNPLPIDLLNRQEIIHQIMRLLDAISATKGSCTFALNGKWGSGKTFVLNMLERQLEEYQAGEKYFVFHYNCWQYDFYDEPLIAIVAALKDSLDKDVNLVPESARIAFENGLKVARPVIQKIANNFAKNKLGIDLTDFFLLFNNGMEIADETKESIDKQHKYDRYYAFKNVMQQAKIELQNLASERTIVVVVDELDRCLPSYAIKVLERLHHLFYENDNTAVLLAVDKFQLDSTIHKIFGDNTNTDEYLKKFINFEFTLDVGTITNGFSKKYADYISLFDQSQIENPLSLDDFAAALFDGIGIRTQERLMEKITTIHRILFPKIKKDYSFMYFELMWLVFVDYYKASNMPINYQQGKFTISRNAYSSKLIEYIEYTWNPIAMQYDPIDSTQKAHCTFYGSIDIRQLLIWYFGQMFPDCSIFYQLPFDYPYRSKHELYLTEFQQINELLKIIK